MEFKPGRIIPTTRSIKNIETRKWADKIVIFLDRMVQDISKIPFNRSEKITYTTNSSSDTEDAVTHHLGYVPEGYILTRQSKAGALYDGDTAWTEDKIYLKCNVASNEVEIKVF